MLAWCSNGFQKDNLVQLVVNRPFIRRKERIGKIGLLVGFVSMFVGIAFVFQVRPDSTWDVYAGAYGAVIVGLIAFNIGSLHWQQWAKKPTPIQAITGALKGLHKKSTLFSYLPHLPVDHLLVTPGGVFILLAKHVDGKVVGEGEQWKHTPLRRFAALINPFSQIRLGQPIAEARAAEAAVRQIVAEALGPQEAAEVPVESVVVFTNIAVQMELNNPAVPTVVPDQLRNHIAQRSRGRLSPGQLEKLTKLFKSEFEVEEEDKKRLSKRAYARR